MAIGESVESSVPVPPSGSSRGVRLRRGVYAEVMATRGTGPAAARFRCFRRIPLVPVIRLTVAGCPPCRAGGYAECRAFNRVVRMGDRRVSERMTAETGMRRRWSARVMVAIPSVGLLA